MLLRVLTDTLNRKIQGNPHNKTASARVARDKYSARPHIKYAYRNRSTFPTVLVEFGDPLVFILFFLPGNGQNIIQELNFFCTQCLKLVLSIMSLDIFFDQ